MSKPPKLPEFMTPRRWLYLAIAFVVLTWGAVLVKGLAGWKNSDRAAFGESFGAVSALFSGLALVAAGWAVYLQRTGMQREKAEATANAVEARFFQMIGSLQMAVNETRVETAKGTYVGRQAMSEIAGWLTHLKPCRELMPEHSGKERHDGIRRWFDRFYDGEGCSRAERAPATAVGLMGHIDRLIYHILKFVNSSDAIGYEQKYAYASILRAHLSNPELVILFYNILSRHGFKKHFPLAAGYRMFKNIDPNTLVDRPGDLKLYLDLVEERKEEITALVGREPGSQIDTATKVDA